MTAPTPTPTLITSTALGLHSVRASPATPSASSSAPGAPAVAFPPPTRSSSPPSGTGKLFSSSLFGNVRLPSFPSVHPAHRPPATTDAESMKTACKNFFGFNYDALAVQNDVQYNLADMHDVFDVLRSYRQQVALNGAGPSCFKEQKLSYYAARLLDCKPGTDRRVADLLQLQKDHAAAAEGVANSIQVLIDVAKSQRGSVARISTKRRLHPSPTKKEAEARKRQRLQEHESPVFAVPASRPPTGKSSASEAPSS